MHENHRNEQYFFDQSTVEKLAGFVSTFESPCCLCAPSLGKKLAELGVDVAVLDIDERFQGVRGFQHWDIYKPTWINRTFDLIICDPPFFNVSLSQLFNAIRLLSQHDFRQRLLVSYLTRRASAIEGTFAPFAITATGFRPGYQTVQKVARNDIQFFGNLTAEETERLSALNRTADYESGEG